MLSKLLQWPTVVLMVVVTVGVSNGGDGLVVVSTAVGDGGYGGNCGGGHWYW